MKDAEDEAFDELAKRQGMWGGGYQAKKAMAADKINADFDEEYQKNSAVLAKYRTAPQPAQEPVARVMGTYGGMFVVAPLNPAAILPVGMALYAGPA